MQMICIGECGSFNPLLLQDLTDFQNELPAAALTQRGTPAQRSSQLVDKKGAFDSDIPRTTSENHEYCMNIACSQYKAQYEIVSVTCCVCYIINFDLFEGLPPASDSI